MWFPYRDSGTTFYLGRFRPDCAGSLGSTFPTRTVPLSSATAQGCVCTWLTRVLMDIRTFSETIIRSRHVWLGQVYYSSVVYDHEAKWISIKSQQFEVRRLNNELEREALW